MAAAVKAFARWSTVCAARLHGKDAWIYDVAYSGAGKPAAEKP